MMNFRLLRLCRRNVSALFATGTLMTSACTSSNFGSSNNKPVVHGMPVRPVKNSPTPGASSSPTLGSDTGIQTDPTTDQLKTFPPGTLNPHWSAQPPVATSTPATSPPQTPIRIFDGGFSGAVLTQALQPSQKNFLWAVTKEGQVSYFRLQAGQVVETKHWTGATGGPGGSRTYVIEGGGLVVARTGGHLYFIDPASPEGDLHSPGYSYYKYDGPGGNERGCLVSYRKSKKRYVGYGYGTGNFIEFAQADAPPFAPIWSNITGQVAGSHADTGGYSCFIDQNRLIYYAQSAKLNSGPLWAIDLKTMTSAALTNAPNAGFVSVTNQAVTNGPRNIAGQGSYAMSGDPNGNIYNGQGAYTMGYEPKSDTVWVSGFDSGTLAVFPAACLTSLPTCVGYAQFNSAQVGFAPGPLSALGDGHMVGMARGPNQIVIMSLKDPTNIALGITATPIANLAGDPYMYTDFTGATLYMTNSETTYDLSKTVLGAPKVYRGIGFSWAQKDPTLPQAWTDIQLEVRCYLASGAQPAYAIVAPVKDALEQTIIQTASCQNQLYDHVDVRLTQLNNNDTLMNVSKVQVTAYQ